jgi:hypothetical protein
MSIRPAHDEQTLSSIGLDAMSASNRRTLETLFRHPLSHNFTWREAISLFENIGTVEEKPNNEYSFRIGSAHHVMCKPRLKDLSLAELTGLRDFAARAGWSPEASPIPIVQSEPTAPDLLVVMDHHEARIYEIDVRSEDITKHVVKPYDPHHFLYHLTHKDQSRERGQRAPEEGSYYESIAQALGSAHGIVLLGHGTGKSNAVHHLAEYMNAHHSETARRIISELSTDFEHATEAQLLDIGRAALA